MNIDSLRSMLKNGQDGLLLRFGLGQALLDAGEHEEAVTHLQKAIEFDPDHSSSWKLLGKALVAGGNTQRAIETYHQGIQVAESNGDKQAVKEMNVFLRRLTKE